MKPMPGRKSATASTGRMKYANAPTIVAFAAAGVSGRWSV